MLRIIFVKGIALAAGCMLSLAVLAANVRNIDVAQGKALQSQGALLLDVREKDEFAEVHAPGGVLVPLGQLKNRINEIRNYERKPVVVICRSGRRSAQAADMLNQLGFTSVHNVQGGMIAWEQARLPVIKPAR